MKKQYVKPVVREQHVHTESLLYTTSIHHHDGEGGEDQPVDAKLNGLQFWVDEAVKRKAQRFWEDEDDTENEDDFWN